MFAALVLARAGLHLWEEPPISGKNGSGTVFFSGCNLGCVYCQNYKISHEQVGKIISDDRLIEIFDGQTLETEKPEYDLPNMFAREERAFLDSIDTGVKTRGNIDYVLETAKLLDLLYQSAEVHEELKA